MNAPRWWGRIFRKRRDGAPASDKEVVEASPPPIVPFAPVFDKYEQAGLQPQKRIVGPRLRQQIVVLGLDFGTSSTKAVYREIESKGRPACAIDFGTVLPGYCRFTFPSSVSQIENCLLYGSEAEVHSSFKGEIHRSYKVRLLRGQGLRHDPRSSLDVGNPAFLSSVYLGVVLRYVRGVITSRIREPIIFFNMDVPVSALDRSSAKKNFERVLRCAVHLSGEPERLLDGRVDHLWEAWRDSWYNGPQNDRCEVVPESLAIASGAGTVLSADENVYKAIVDIGGGTTDVAWLKILKRVEEDRLPVFASGTSMVGCDDLDIELVRLLTGRHPGLSIGIGEIRAMKAAVLSGRGQGQAQPLSGQDIEGCGRAFSARAYEFYSKMFGEAYKMEPDTTRWKRIEVVVCGGGSRIPAVRDNFRLPPRAFVERVDLAQLHSSNDLGCDGESHKSPTADEMTFLLPALGLSFPSVELPKPKLPSEIEAWRPEKKGPTGIYDYEADGYV